MLAARAHPGETSLRLEQTAIPELGHGEALVRVHASAVVQGLIFMWQAGHIPLLPATLGMHIAGTVAEVAGDVEGWGSGDRVRVYSLVTCAQCDRCRNDTEFLCPTASLVGSAVFYGEPGLAHHERYHNGGLAEYVRVPATALEKLPDTIPFAVGARIHDAGVAVHAIRESGIQAGGTLVALGASGAQGAVLARFAPRLGVERLIAVGRSRSRLDEIRALDPKHVEVLALEELGDRWLEDDGLVRAIRDLVPTGADAVIDYLPDTPAGGQAIRSLRPGGTSVVLGGNPYGLNVPGRLVMLNCWRVIGTRFASRRDAATAAALVASGEVRMDDLITHTFPLARVNEAVELVRERRAPAWLVNVEVSAGS
jgi:threonine dehydrogenase-like Zn-dependent dehydrogenase